MCSVSHVYMQDAEMVEEIKIEAASPSCVLPEDDADDSNDCQFFQISGLLQQLEVSRESSVMLRKPSDVFCLGVAGLYFKCLPGKMRRLMGQSCQYGELTHARFTLLLCTNLDGSEKVPLLCVGSPDNGQCFRNSRSIEYNSNLNSFLTANM